MRKLLSVGLACVCLAIAGPVVSSPALAEAIGGGLTEQFTIGWDPMDLPGMQADFALDQYGAINSAERAAEVAPYIANLDAHGISYMAYYGFDHVEGDAYDYFPALNTDQDSDGIIDGVWVSLEGNYREDYGMPGFYLHTIGSQAFRDYLIASAELTIDAGGTAACYDVALFSSTSFDPGSIAEFAYYLSTGGFNPVELDLPAETDLSTFDYGAYLRDQGYTDAGITAAASGWWDNPENTDYSVLGLDSILGTALWTTWANWHDIFLHQFTQQLSTITKAYASIQYGTEFSIALNRYGNGMRWLVSDIVDFECGETFINDPSFNYPYQSLAPVYKANLTNDQTRFWSWNWPEFRDGSGTLTDLAPLFAAETLATGGILQATLSPGEEDLLAALKPYNQLKREYPELLSLTPTADTALFYCLGSNLGNEQSFKGTANLLADSHVDYNVILGADDVIREDAMNVADLAPYSTVVLPNAWALTDNQINALMAYVNGGGQVIVSGGVSTGQNLDWQNLINAGGGTYGAGLVFMTTADYGNNYWNATDLVNREFALAFWQSETGGILEGKVTTFLPDVNIYSYIDPSDGSGVYHLVNSMYDESAGQVIPQTNCTLRLPYPDGWGGDVTVSLIRPGDSAPTVLGTFTPEQTIEVLIDNLDIWGIIKVGSSIPAPLTFDDMPFSEAKTVFDYEYWDLNGDDQIEIHYEATDDIDIVDLNLYYRYRAADIDEWSRWLSAGTEEVTGDPVTHYWGVWYYDPFGAYGDGEGYYQFRMQATDMTQSEPGKSWPETERGCDITPPQDVPYTESHGVLSGVATTITDPSFTWTAPVDVLSGTALPVPGNPWQILWGPTGNPQGFSSDTMSFTPDPIYPNGPSTEYQLWVRTSDVAGNWNGGDLAAFVYSLELPGAPYVLSYDADEIFKTSAQLNSNVVSPGDASEVEVSYIWGVESGNYVYETTAETLTGSGTAATTVTGLIPDTTYYFRAKAAGIGTYTVYGDEHAFTTAGSDVYQLTIDSGTGGSVTVPGEGNFLYNPGTVVDLTAEADSGYVFELWTGDVGSVTDTGSGTTTITMNGDYSIVAAFTGINNPPSKPVNQLPVDGADLAIDEVVLQASAFVDDGDTHVASEWRVGNNVGVILQSSGETTEYLTSYSVPAIWLDYETTYTWYVRYQDSAGNWSEWSDMTTFTTLPDILPGDANGDGTINVLDLTSIERQILLLDAESAGADANGDGEVNVLDVTKVVRMIVGLE